MSKIQTQRDREEVHLGEVWELPMRQIFCARACEYGGNPECKYGANDAKYGTID